MNKKLVYILIAIITFIIMCLVGLMGYCITNGGFSFGGPSVLLKEKTYDLTEIRDISFDFVSADIEFFESNNNELKVVQYGSEKNKKFIDTESSNSIEIEDSTRMNFIFFNFQFGSRYEIYLPSNYTGNLNIKTVSGEINLSDFNLSLNDLTVKTTSGDIDLNSIFKANDVEIKSVSGEINVKDIVCDDATFKTTSGDIEIDKVISKDIEMNTVSGEMVLGKIEGIVTAKTTSGEISIDDLKILDNSKLSSVSGEITVRMNDDNNCVISTDSLSGDSDISSNKYGNKEFDLNIKTTSGDIRVD